MTDKKRSLLAAALSLLVLLIWFYFFGEKPSPPPPSVPTPTPLSTKVETPPQEVRKETAPPVALPDTRVSRETPLLDLEWSSRGGALAKVLLKRYRQEVDEKSPPMNLVPFEGERPLEVLCEGCSGPLPQVFRILEGAQGISFEGENEGIFVRKEYEWRGDQYLFNLRIVFENRRDQEFRGRVGLGWHAKQFPPKPKGMLDFLKGPETQRSFLYRTGREVERLQKEGAQEVRGIVPWAGIEDRYFLIALISRRVSSDQGLRLQYQGDRLDLALFPGDLLIPPGGRHEELFSFYLGPKERGSLQVAQVGLEEAIDYGWFTFLAIPILKLLQIFQMVVKNWGLAVIVLTIVVKILMNPLTVRSMKQMKEMQKLQPRMAELKEKYKEDKQRLNMEMMQLFKTYKVNPMGGCFPILLQMPIYIALYKVLYNSIELYHAPFFWFYRDLSAPDPYFVLPILLGVSMVAQQKMTPSTGADPAQRQMMMIMPVMFTAFMLFLPVGLVVYIFVNTLFSVIQQWMYQKGIRLRDLVGGRKAPAPS